MTRWGLNLLAVVALLAMPAQAIAQSASSGLVGAPASTYAGQIAGQDAAGNLRVPFVDANGAQSVLGKGGALIASGQVAVTTSTTLVAPARTGRSKIIISSTSAVVFYVGATGVTSATGLYVPAAAGATIVLDTAAAVYAVGASAVTLSYAELY